MACRSITPSSMMLSINSFFGIGTRLPGLSFHPSTYSLKAFPRFHTRSSNCVYFSLLYQGGDKHGLHFSEEFNARHARSFYETANDFLWNYDSYVSLRLSYMYIIRNRKCYFSSLSKEATIQQSSLTIELP